MEFFDACVIEDSDGDAGKRFVEKTPQHILHLPFILKWFPQAQVIHLVRDGRDCYCSSKINIDIPQNKSAKEFASYWKNVFLSQQNTMIIKIFSLLNTKTWLLHQVLN